MAKEFFQRVHAYRWIGKLEPAERNIPWGRAFPLSPEGPITYDPNTKLEAQLAEAFKLSQELYAGPVDTPHEDDDFPWNIASIRRSRLGRFTLQALEAEYISGKLGLVFISSQLCKDSLELQKDRRLNELAHHGSTIALDRITPHQANWEDAQGRLYADGEIPSVRASGNTNFPTTRAILHKVRPELADLPLVLSKQKDRHNRTYWFTSEEALEAVRDATGYVHVIDPQENNDPHPSYYDLERREYVIFGGRESLTRVRVGVDDLPSSICVLPVANRNVLHELKYYDNPRQLGDDKRIEIRRLDNMWPTEFYPR